MNRNFCLLVLLGLTALLVGSAPAIIFVEETINVGVWPRAILYDSIDGKIFVANYSSASVSVVNPANMTVTSTIPVDSYPTAMCWIPTSTKLYVLHTPLKGSGTVTVLDAYTNAYITSINVGVKPLDIVWNSTRNKAYCINGDLTGSVSAIDCSSDEVVATIRFTSQYAGSGIVYNPVSDHIYATNNKVGLPGRVTVINCENDEAVGSITVGNSAVELAVNPVSNKVYVSNRVSNSVSVINGATNQRIGNILTHQRPMPLLWVPPNRLFIGQYWDSTVAFLGGDELTIPSQNHIAVAGTPGTLCAAPDCEQVFSGLDLAGVVAGLNARSGQERVIDQLGVGAGPGPMAYYQPQNRVFVANAWDSTVTIVRTEVAVEEPGRPVRPSGPPQVRAMPSPVPARNTVSFRVSGFAPTRLDIRDADGRLVHSAAGSAARAWKATTPGVYFCTLSSGAANAVCKLAVR